MTIDLYERGAVAIQLPAFRAARVARGLSLREVARRTDIDPSQLSKVERGMVGLSVENLRRLADVLELRDLTAALALVMPEERA